MNYFCTSPVSANSKAGERRGGDQVSRESLPPVSDVKLLHLLESHQLIKLEPTIQSTKCWLTSCCFSGKSNNLPFPIAALNSSSFVPFLLATKLAPLPHFTTNLIYWRGRGEGENSFCFFVVEWFSVILVNLASLQRAKESESKGKEKEDGWGLLAKAAL